MREVELLSEQLDQLIKTYTLPEVLNTIANLVSEHQKEDASCTEEWKQLAIELEEATDAALNLANQHEDKEKFWK